MEASYVVVAGEARSDVKYVHARLILLKPAQILLLLALLNLRHLPEIFIRVSCVMHTELVVKLYIIFIFILHVLILLVRIHLFDWF